MSQPINHDVFKIIQNKVIFTATKYSQSVVTSEHILHAILTEKSIMAICDELDIQHKVIVKNLEAFFKDIAAPGPLSDVIASEDYKKIFSFASIRVQSSGRDTVRMEDIFEAFTTEDEDLNETYGKQQLLKYGFVTVDLRRYLADVAHEASEKVTETEGATIEGAETKAKKKNNKPDFIINLNKKAEDGKIDSLTGRGDEINRMAQILIRRRKNNPILVGEAGVGKTAIAEGLALKIVKGEVHDRLKDKVIYLLDIGMMMAGTKYRGDVEERFGQLMRYLKDHSEIVLYIDEIHTIIGAGAAGNSSMDLSNMMKPSLANGEISLIGSTTFKEYKQIEKDAAFARRLQKIDVVEPSEEDTFNILMNLKGTLEAHHSVKYTDESLRLAVSLSKKYVNDRFLPDKAIDVLDEAGAYVTLNTTQTEVNREVIEKVIAKMARIPEKTLTVSEKDKMKNLSENLKMLIFGQDQAIDDVVSTIELSKAGLRKGTKPIGNFLFAGTTGVGKTELVIQLSKQMGIDYLRLDMSEYDKEHSSEKLIGSPPGYVGHGEGGILTNFVSKHPYSIILFDELEKAHEKCWNYLLQIMDHATLTDSEGKKVDFRNCIIVMTSNAGAAEIQRKNVGLTAPSTVELKARPNAAINARFTPEFRNRIDKIITFNPLTMANALMILNKLLMEADTMIADKNVIIEYTKEAKEWLVNKGYDQQMGARPMERVVEEYIKKPLSKEILYGELSEDGGNVLVSLKDDKIVIEAKKTVKKKEAKAKKVKETNE